MNSHIKVSRGATTARVTYKGIRQKQENID
jgi:hypothetical protein